MKYSNSNMPPIELYPRTDSKKKVYKMSPRAITAKRQRTADKIIRILAASTTVFLILALIAIVVLLLGSCSSASAAKNTSLKSDKYSNSISATEENYPAHTGSSSVVLPLTRDAGIYYQNSICFLGDSLTYHLISREVLNGGKNTKQVLAAREGMLNLNSDITRAKVVLPETNDTMTIADAVSIKKPHLLIITLGTDWGVSYLKEKDFKYCYSKLITAVKKASPDTDIILQSIFPVTSSCTLLDNTKIDRANTWVRAIAEEHGLKYLNTQEILKGDDNALRPEFCNSADGIHLGREAYVEILRYIRTHAWIK